MSDAKTEVLIQSIFNYDDETYTISDDGGDYDDEAELDASNAASVVAERIAYYQGEGRRVIIDVDTDIMRFL